MTKHEKDRLDQWRFATIMTVIGLILFNFFIGMENDRKFSEYVEQAELKHELLLEVIDLQQEEIQKLNGLYRQNLAAVEHLQRSNAIYREGISKLYGKENLNLTVEEIIGKYMESEGE